MAVIRARATFGLLGLGCALAGVPVHAAEIRGPDGDWLTEAGSSVSACGGAGRFAASVSERLGKDASVAARMADIRVALEDSPASEPRALVLSFSDGTGRPLGRRVFAAAASTCEATREAAAVAVALFLLDRGPAPAPAAPASNPSEAAPVLAPTSVPAAPATLAARGKVTRPPAEPWLAGVRAAAVDGGGHLPWGTWGGEVTVRARKRGWPELFAGGAFFPRQGGTYDAIRLSWVRADGRAGLCPFQRRWAARAVSGCAAVTVGWSSVDAPDVTPSYPRRSWTAGGDVGLALDQRLGAGWWVGVEARLVVPFVRDRVQVADDAGMTRDLFRGGPVGAAGLLAIQYSMTSAGR